MIRLLLTLSFVGAFYSFANLIYYWDPSRIIVKKMTSPDQYRYEEINPKYLETDPKKLINFSDQSDLVEKRKALKKVIFGSALEFSLSGIKVVKDVQNNPSDCKAVRRYQNINCKAVDYKTWKNLAGIDQLQIPIIEDMKAKYKDEERLLNHTTYITFFRAAKKTNRLVIYHHGLAGVYHDQFRHLEALIGQEYDVLAFNSFGYGLNKRPGNYLPGDLPATPDPFHVFFKPVDLALTYALKQRPYKSVDMIGLSAGGWAVSVVAAYDTRIRSSYPVSGVFPVYLREKKERPAPQLYPPLLKAATYPEMFVLGSSGKGRRQMQIFNRYDRCCYRNLKGKLYEKAVKEALSSLGETPDSFTVLIDETHARHKISAFGMKAILADMERLNQSEQGARQ